MRVRAAVESLCGSVFFGNSGLVGSGGVNEVIGFWTAQLKGNPEEARSTTKKARADGVVGFLKEAEPGQKKSLGTDAFTASDCWEASESELFWESFL